MCGVSVGVGSRVLGAEKGGKVEGRGGDEECKEEKGWKEDEREG